MTALSRTAARIPQPAVARLGALLLAASVPVLLLHVDHQPQVSLDLGGTDASLKLSDLAVLALAAAAVAVLVRDVGSLRPAAVVLAPALALLAWVGAGVVVGAVSDRPYATGTHLVTAAGFVEYAMIAVAVAVLVRSAAALRLVLWTLVGWLAVLDVVGLAQFAGLGDTAAGERQPSWIGYHDLAATGATTLAIGLVGLALGDERWLVGRLREAACAAGALGLVLSGSVGGALGLVGAAVLVVAVAALLRSLTARRLVTITAIVLATVVGVVALRGGDLAQFGRFVGLLEAQETTSEDVQTYSHRTLLGYFGLRVFVDRPVAGAGWQATQEFTTLEPYLADAHDRFPDVAAQAFPSEAEPYGVQNAYVQALADLGLVGLVLFLAALAIPIAIGVRAALRRTAPGPALAGAAVVLACAGAWTAQGLVAGLPLDALTWFGVGLVAAALSTPPADG
ncbi:MAG: O-antigen ligase family protein [Gaiellaceae bacterium MAG52_C11]|nr:O-antigen ligase family protein [Candidatus Gaiellasilicea maunaloa]